MRQKSKDLSQHIPRRGDIYWIQFPSPYGPHFAVVVSSDERNSFGVDVLVAQITSQRASELGYDEVALPIGILPKASKIKCYHMLVVSKKIISPENFRGRLDKKTLQGVDEALKIALDLW